MNSSKKHINSIDDIRGIAVIAVFLFHSFSIAFDSTRLPWAGWISDFSAIRSFPFLLPFSMGWIGVPIFFVVSGFCIHLSFSRNPTWRDFFIRRFFRIYPPYFFAVLFLALFSLYRYEFSSMVHQLVSHLMLIHNYEADTCFGINGSFWTIAVEVQLYLLYPVLLVLVKRFGWHRSLLYIATLEIGLRTLLSIISLANDNELPPNFSAIGLLTKDVPFIG